jgi:acyl-CoA synthetase (NDP forming)
MGERRDRFDLDKLLRPRSIAVIGASDASRVGRASVENLIRQGYAGRIYPVNPNYEQVVGLPCYPSVDALPEATDAALVATAPARVLPLLAQCGEAGIGAAVVAVDGLRPTTTAGSAEAELRELAERYRMAICGPNCMGILNSANGGSLYIGVLENAVSDRGISAVVQSGSLGLALSNSTRHPGFRYVISSGNETVLTAADYVRYLARDQRTKVIALVLEGVRDPDGLLEGVRMAKDAGKAVVLVKLATSDAGRRLAVSHTGALAGDADVAAAVCRQFGIGQVRDLEELLDACALLSRYPSPASARAGAITLSGGYATLLGDLAEVAGIELTPWSPAAADRLRPHAPDGLPRNPFDAWTSGSFEDVLQVALGAACDDDGTDFTIVVQDLPPVDSPHRSDVPAAVVRLVADAAATSAKPLLVLGAVGEPPAVPLLAGLDAAQVPYLAGGSAPLRAMAAWVAAGVAPTDAAPTSPGPATPLAVAWRELREAGIAVVPERFVTTAADAVSAADELGYPAVLKVHSADLPHKSDVGGVVVGLERDQVAGEYERMLQRVKSTAPAARIDGVTVQRQCAPGLEMIVGAIRDPDWGWIISCGFGGIHVEALRDIAFRRVPIDRREARRMLSELRLRGLLAGSRGTPARDDEALTDLLTSFSDLVQRHASELDQVEFNPVVVHEAGRGLSIVDTLFVRTPNPVPAAAHQTHPMPEA